MKGGNKVCDPCSDESKKTNAAILSSLEETKKLINESTKACPMSARPSLKGAVTAVRAAKKLQNISETKKSRDPSHWHLYENDSGKYWENGDESEAFWVNDVGDIVPSGWTVIKAPNREDGLHYFEKGEESRWYLTTDEIGETNLDDSKKWKKSQDKNGRAYWKKHTNPYLWEVRWVDPKDDYEKQIAKEYKVGNITKYERDMTRADIDTWVKQFGDNVPVSVARIAAKLREKVRNGGKRRTKKRRRKYRKKTKKRRRKSRKKTRRKKRRKSRKKKTKKGGAGAVAAALRGRRTKKNPMSKANEQRLKMLGVYNPFKKGKKVTSNPFRSIRQKAMLQSNAQRKLKI